MDKYKAQRNEEAEQPQKTQDEINTENNANNIKNVAEVASKSANPYAKAAGYAVKGLDKLTGGKSTQALGSAMTKANKMAPGGQQIQNASNKLSESGTSDKISQAAAAKSGGKGGTKGVSKASGNANSVSKSGSTSSGGSSSIGGDLFAKLPTSLKIKLIVGGFGALIFVSCIMTVFAGKDNANLSLTNDSSLTGAMSSVSRKCTKSEVESKLVYVGDSRTANMQNAINNESIQYINDNSANYEWLNSSGLSNIEAKLNENSNMIVVLTLGINDLENADNYITKYKELISKYPNTKFFILSVNPVNQSDTSGSVEVTNDDINSFNQKMRDAFPSNYIDSNTNLNNFGYSDGMNYTDESYNNINNYVVDSLINHTSIVCGGGNISDINADSLNGGNATMLNQSLTSLLGESGVQSWNEQLKSSAQSAGYGTGLAPATVAFQLIQMALDQGVIIPYFYGGGHDAPSLIGINGEWGASKRLWVGTNAQPAGSMHPYGMDCSGFVSWAMRNGGCTNFSSIIASSFIGLGSSIEASDVAAGDIIAKSSHVMIALSNDGNNIIVAEAKGARYGIIFSSYTYDNLRGKGYTFVSMSKYYSENCKG